MVGSSWKELLVHFVEVQHYPRNHLCEQSTVQRRSRTGVKVDRSRSFGCKNTSSDTISERRASFFRLFMGGGHIVGVPYFKLFCNDLRPRQQIAVRDVAWQPTSASFAAIQAWLLQSQANQQVAA